MTRGRVRYNDLGRLHESIRPELDAAFDEVIKSSDFVGARTSAVFETEFASASGRRGSVGVGSGTDALALALRALEVGAGMEVILPANTFIATAEAVLHAGATPVLADIDPETLLLSPATVAEVQTRKTGCVIPVHLYGHVVPFDFLEAWSASGLAVVEDAAQAHLGTWRGRKIGEASDAACFSFFPGKNLGALGDAGAVVSDRDATLAELRRLRDHGRSSKDVHETVGWCSRLDGLQAAFLRVKLRHLPAWTAARAAIADSYRRRLEGSNSIRLVPWEDGAVHHGVVVRVASRDDVVSRLAAAGIETGVHYRYALTEQRALQPWSRECKQAELAAREILTLPCDPLMSEDDVDFVCDALVHACGANAV